MSEPSARPRKVLITVHGDAWGMVAANTLVKAAMDQGVEIQLLVTKKRPLNEEAGWETIGSQKIPRLHADSRNPARAGAAPKLHDEVPQLRQAAYFKEIHFNKMLDYIDSHIPADPARPASLLSFKGLQRLIGQHNQSIGGGTDALHEVAFVPFLPDNAGKYTINPSGRAFEAVVDRFRPDVILSCDHLTIIPKSVLDHVPVYGIHPGPMPEATDLLATAKQVVNRRFETIQGAPHVIVSMHRLASKIDHGTVIAEFAVPYDPAMSLFQVRMAGYKAAVDMWAQAMPQLLHESIAGAPQPQVAEADKYRLTPAQMEHWLRQPGNQLLTRQDMQEVIEAVLPQGQRLADLPETLTGPLNDLPERAAGAPASSLMKHRILPRTAGGWKDSTDFNGFTASR